ncbi:aspartate aminotransferase, mitochondrial-like [Diorhabda carinulata]|uniref:aspartate aminotransferase, mitochondrial-like n=1 Tax=Diorhabda carinulata TaxID=1163345 RepID=UPI0025A141D3|nr:aspartate aminotransferase, mitochondrial-like [Diorhabda carinulata]
MNKKKLAITKFLIPFESVTSYNRNLGWFTKVPKAPPDNIFGVLDAYNKDKSKEKVNLTVGAYRDDNGKPYVLQTVREAEKRIRCKNMNKEYLGLLGNLNFNKLTFNFALGEDNKFLKNGRAALCQSLSGTGAVFIAAVFLSTFFPKNKVAYVSKPTWGNHISLLERAGLCVKTYRYYNTDKVAIDFEGMLDDINKMPDECIILFHAAAHNPTGFDPNCEQWQQLADLCKKKSLYVIFDNAYQGFATGDAERDATSIRIFAENDINMAICQSFSKNMGLYGERIGCCAFITDSPAETEIAESQLKFITRSMYSNPPIHGARIVEEILSNVDLKNRWLQEVKKMAERMRGMRASLRDGIIRAGSKLNWDHITNQIGMFSFTAVKKEAVAKLKKDFHVYLLNSGRISVSGLNSKNVEYVGAAFHKVTSV